MSNEKRRRRKGTVRRPMSRKGAIPRRHGGTPTSTDTPSGRREARSAGRPRPAEQRRYWVDMRSVLAGVDVASRLNVEAFETYEAVRDHALAEVEDMIAGLAGVAAELKRAVRFESLDLGWYKPLLTEVLGEGDPNHSYGRDPGLGRAPGYGCNAARRDPLVDTASEPA